jgi:hypothetical protein
LPGHIAAALAGAGGAGDSAGQPWTGRSLVGEYAKIHNFEDDDGSADAGYLTAVHAMVHGTGDEEGIVRALAHARVFVPIVAQLGEEGQGAAGLHADKQADMALVTLKARDGRTALPVFSSTDSLHAWHQEARPVAVYAARAALSAVAEGAELMVLDPGSEATIVVRRPAVWALAQQHTWSPSYADPEVASVVETIASDIQQIQRVELHRGGGVPTTTGGGLQLKGGGAGPELRIVLYLDDGLDASGVQAVVAGMNTALARNELFAERVDSVEVKLRRAVQ